MVYGIGQLNYVSHIWLRQTLVAMVTKICDFQHKIGYDYILYTCTTGVSLSIAGSFVNKNAIES